MRTGMVLALALTGAGCGGVREAQEARYETHRVGQATAEYEQATDNLGRCLAAKLVAVAHADAGRAADAQAWRARETADCRAAYADMEAAGVMSGAQ